MNDRIGRCGDGVVIYLRSHIPFSILDVSKALGNASAEHLFIEVISAHITILFRVYYNLSLILLSNRISKGVQYYLSKYKLLYDPTLLMANLNTYLEKITIVLIVSTR